MALPSILQDMNWAFPDYVETTRVERDRMYEIESEDQILSEIMPLNEADGDAVAWYKDDNVVGLMPSKALGAPFPQVGMTGAQVFSVPASVFAAETTIDAKMLVAAAKVGTNGSVRLSAMEKLAETLKEHQYRFKMLRDLQRCQALTLGKVEVYDENQNVVNTYIYEGVAQSLITLSGSDKWDQPTTATPLTLLRNLQNQSGVLGRGFDFGAGAVALMSGPTMETLLATTQMINLRNRYGSSMFDENDLNEFTKSGRGGIVPMLKRVTGTAIMPGNVVKKFMPDGYVVVVGRHPARGLRAGNWTFTSNENLLGAPGLFATMDVRSANPRLPYCALAGHGAPSLQVNQVVTIKVY